VEPFARIEGLKLATVADLKSDTVSDLRSPVLGNVVDKLSVAGPIAIGGRTIVWLALWEFPIMWLWGTFKPDWQTGYGRHLDAGFSGI